MLPYSAKSRAEIAPPKWSAAFRRFCVVSVATTSMSSLGPKPVNLAKLIVGSEGTLGIILEAKLNLVPLPKAKAVLVIQFQETLEALAATPFILEA